MLNEDKVKLMTNIAMFEKREGKRIFPLGRYFKGDYISTHIIRSFISYTFCFFMVTAVWILYSIDRLLNASDTDDLFRYGKRALLIYVVGLVVYLAITWRIYSERYDYAKRGLRVYQAKLRRLEKRYDSQGRKNW